MVTISPLFYSHPSTIHKLRYMDPLCSLPPVAQEQVFIVAPREICQSCHNPSGPKFVLSSLRGSSDLHRKNVIPTGPDRVLADSNISYAQSEIVLLDKEIARLQQSVNALQNRRDALQQFEYQERCLFTPIRKLPEDVLRQIFLQPHLHSNRIYACYYDPQEFIQKVTQVSAHRRFVAHSCALLWSSFSANPHESKMSSRTIAMLGRFIEQCLLLSKDVPLSISIGIRYSPEILSEHCIKMIAQNAYRWKDVAILNRELLKAIESRIPADTSLTHLQRLNLNLSQMTPLP
ncbi:hypothetical protein BDQ17DRAFT_481501 [Cyathus striatus]|nr:hypothetical protein BDQ17DRAFT_481501 [Cyathus striatus]